MRKAYTWNIDKRKALEEFCKEGYNKAKLAELMGVSIATICYELQRGLTEEEYNERRYVKYSAVEATLEEGRKILGEDGLNTLLELGMGEDKDGSV